MFQYSLHRGFPDTEVEAKVGYRLGGPGVLHEVYLNLKWSHAGVVSNFFVQTVSWQES